MLDFLEIPELLVQVGAHNAATLTFTAADSSYPALTAQITWGDGQVDEVTGQDTVVADLTHTYAGFGEFLVTVTVTNRAFPTPQAIIWSDTASYVTPNFEPVIDPQLAAAVRGPVLPRDRGAGVTDGWSFDIGTDDRVLVSSLYLLLTTARGERLMLPNYGTNLRRLIFSLTDDTLDDAIRADIAQAVSQWEPRAQLDSVAVNKTGSTIVVSVSFKSLISGVTLPVQVAVS